MAFNHKEQDNYSASDVSSEISEKKEFVGIIDKANEFIKELFYAYTEHMKFYKFEVHTFKNICEYLSPKSKNFFKPLFIDENSDLQIYSWMYGYAKNGKKIYLYVVYNPLAQHETPDCESFFQNILDEKNHLIEEINLIGNGLTFLFKGTESGFDKSILNEIKSTFARIKITQDSLKQFRFKKILELKNLMNSYMGIVVDNFQIFKNFKEARTFASIGSDVEIPNLSDLLAVHYPERDFTQLKESEGSNKSYTPPTHAVRPDGKKTFSDVLRQNVVTVVESNENEERINPKQIHDPPALPDGKKTFSDVLRENMDTVVESTDSEEEKVTSEPPGLERIDKNLAILRAFVTKADNNEINPTYLEAMVSILKLSPIPGLEVV